MINFLHDYGYNLFSIPKLTYPEINYLVDAYNAEQKEKVKESNRQEKRNKMRNKTR